MKSAKRKRSIPPYKKALFKNLNLAPSFPLTKKAKKDFHQTPTKKRGFKKRGFKKRGFKKKGFKKESLKEIP